MKFLADGIDGTAWYEVVSAQGCVVDECTGYELLIGEYEAGDVAVGPDNMEHRAQ